MTRGTNAAPPNWGCAEASERSRVDQAAGGRVDKAGLILFR